MPSILTFRRGTAAQNDAFTGSAGEITVDTTNGTIRVHDGVTAGGSQVATANTLGALALLDNVDTAQIVDAAITADKLAPGVGGGMKSMQVFTSSGTWTKPSGISKVKVFVTGGGGGAAAGDGGTNTGDGGGAGGTAIKFIDVSSVSTVSVTVGVGGGGGTSSTSVSGDTGGTSSFGAYCSAAGGTGGVQWNTSSRGGFGGAASGGDINITGGDGEQATPHDAVDDGPGAHGGASYWGGGGKGAQSYAYEKASRPGQAYGSGGGSGLHTGSISFPGSAGKAGIVVVEEYA